MIFIGLAISMIALIVYGVFRASHDYNLPPDVRRDQNIDFTQRPH